RRRCLPRLAREFTLNLRNDIARNLALFEKLASLPDKAMERPVWLFSDTFVKYYEPKIAFFAYIFLLQIGCLAVPAPPWLTQTNVQCCGRPMISNGLLTEAARLANHNVETLFSFAAGGQPIIASEPSCILTIKDDYPALLRGEERRKAE